MGPCFDLAGRRDICDSVLINLPSSVFLVLLIDCWVAGMYLQEIASIKICYMMLILASTKAGLSRGRESDPTNVLLKNHQGLCWHHHQQHYWQAETQKG
jgi:hypothetical protein